MDRIPEDMPFKPGETERKLFVIAMRCGRLANRLILFANFIAFAEEHGYRVSNVTFHSYAHLFETTARDIYCRYPAPSKPSFIDSLPGAPAALRTSRIFYHGVRYAARLNEFLKPFGSKVLTLRELPIRDITMLEGLEIRERIAAADTIFVFGWGFRAAGAIRTHAERVRAYFRPVRKIQERVSGFLGQIRQNAEVVVGVHIRKGDYRTWLNGRYLFETSQYAAWMREMAEQFPDKRLAFVACSDEPLDRGQFGDLPVEILSGSPVEDLYLLADSDFIFGPPSTFSQWASFYGQTPLLHLTGNTDRVDMRNFSVSFLDEIPGISAIWEVLSTT